jgi:hypothetical protein
MMMMMMISACSCIIILHGGYWRTDYYPIDWYLLEIPILIVSYRNNNNYLRHLYNNIIEKHSMYKKNNPFSYSSYYL